MSMYAAATSVAAALRATGASVDLLPTHQRTRKAFDYANKVPSGLVRRAPPFPGQTLACPLALLQ
jgi:hypothetical protein